MSTEKKELFSHAIMALQFLSLWPIQSKYTIVKRLHKLYGILINLYYVCIMILCGYNVYENQEDMKKFTTNISTIIMNFTGLVKAYSLLVHGEKYEELVVMICEKYLSYLKSKETIQIFNKKRRHLKILVYSLWFFVSLTCSYIVFAPVVEYCKLVLGYANDVIIDKIHVFPMCLPWNIEENYAFFIFLQMLFTLGSGAVQVTWDVLFFSLVIYGVAHLEILKHNITHMTSVMSDDNVLRVENEEQDEEMVKDDNIQKKVYGELINCINDHYFIRRYVNILNDLVSPTLFVYYILSGLMVCSEAFQVSEEGLQKTQRIQFLAAIVTQLYIFCHIVNEIIEKKNELLFASYDCEWYNQNIRFKRSLMNFSVGLTLPIELTVGKFFSMSLGAFLAVMKTAYSIFTLLKKVQEKDA